jgi:hypothetical protein
MVLIKDYTEIFYMTDEGDMPSIQCKTSLRGPKSMGKVDCLSLIFIDFYVPGLTPRLSSSETWLHLSVDRALFAECLLTTLWSVRISQKTTVYGYYCQYYSKHWAIEQWQSLSACNKAVAESQKVSGFRWGSAVYLCSPCCLLQSTILFGVLVYPEDRKNTFLRKFGWLSQDCSALYHKR